MDRPRTCSHTVYNSCISAIVHSSLDNRFGLKAVYTAEPSQELWIADYIEAILSSATSSILIPTSSYQYILAFGNSIQNNHPYQSPDPIGTVDLFTITL